MSRSVTAIACAAFLVAGTASAQEPGAVGAGVRFVLGVEEGPSRWRVYAEPRELQFRLSLTNQSNSAIRIDQRVLREAFVLRVNQEQRADTFQEVAVRVDWLDRVSISSEVLERIDADVAVHIQPDTTMMWTVVVSRSDGQPFSRGSYQIARGFQNFRDAVRTADGTAWSGRVPDGTAQWTIRVEPGTSPAERAIPDLLAAEEAKRVRDFDAALDLYRRAAVEDPVNSTAILGMADTYLHLARYREALSVLSDVAGRPGWSIEAIAGSLGQAYVGVGDVASAAKLLQSIGLSEEEAATAIREMRQYVADNPPR